MPTTGSVHAALTYGFCDHLLTWMSNKEANVQEEKDREGRFSRVTGIMMQTIRSSDACKVKIVYYISAFLHSEVMINVNGKP